MTGREETVKERGAPGVMSLLEDTKDQQHMGHTAVGSVRTSVTEQQFNETTSPDSSLSSSNTVIREKHQRDSEW